MRGSKRRNPRWFVPVLLLVWLTGCAAPSPPSRFYRLESTAPSTAMPQPQVPSESLPLIGVGPVRLANYLDRPQLVERSSPHRLKMHEFDRWAGTLQENTLQVLSEVMQRELSVAQVIGYPWHSSVRPDYEVAVTIIRFERLGERLRLEARWTLVDQPQGRLIRLGRRPFETLVEGNDMEDLVRAASVALEQLGQVLATELAPLLATRH